MTLPPKKEFGRLEFLCLAAALCFMVGSAWGLEPFDLPIALLLLTVLYGVLRDVRSLNRLNHRMTTPPHSRNPHAEQTDRASR
ncbi:MAG: hypothetical protein K0S79_1938 [Nitrospira sp.]|jgi:hypothetical protein|nr:hypothetical protein [Nitrospira sp.]